MYGQHQFATWQQFVQRPDNKGLTVEQMRGKYVYEQFVFEQLMMQQIVPAVTTTSAGGGESVDPSFNEFVESGYVDDYLE